jgi:DNA-binding transcriptional ArsR family regulator
MKPIRTYAGGLYEIYGRDGDGEPLMIAPDKLDTSLSLGMGKLGADDWKPGLRDELTTDDKGNTITVAEARIEAYAERWQTDQPTPQILVLGEVDAKGEYTGRWTPKVIDGAMWVAAAEQAGIGRVPVYVVAPTLPGLELDAMWLYFNTIANGGAALTDRKRRKIITELAKRGRDSHADTTSIVTVEVDGKKIKVRKWVDEYARATGTARDVVTEWTKGIFSSRRTQEQRDEDLEKFKAEIQRRLAAKPPVKLTGLIGWLAKESGKTKTAIRKWLTKIEAQGLIEIPRPGPRRPRTSPQRSSTGNGNAPVNAGGGAHRPTGGAPALGSPTGNGAPGRTGETFGGTGAVTGELADVARLLEEAEPGLNKALDVLEQLTARKGPKHASLAERPDAHANIELFWTSTIESLFETLLELAVQLEVHSDSTRARSHAGRITKVFELVSHTLRRSPDQLIQSLNGSNGSQERKQVALFK